MPSRRCLYSLSALLLTLWAPGSLASNPSIAFYYADHPPDLLAQFDQVVVEPQHVDARELKQLRRHGASIFAYVSVGEVQRSRPWHGHLNRAWFLGENPDWDSDIVDLGQAGWREFLIEQRMQALWDRGYRAFFLDTLDSYLRVVSEAQDVAAQEAALITLVRDIKHRFPTAKLLLNRGFPIIPEVAPLVDGVVAESLFASWNPASEGFESVAETDRQWLLGQLTTISDTYRLPVTVIDYLPPARRDEAHAVARQIAALGFTPWVAGPHHDYLGIGALEVLPREILLLYDSGPEASELFLVHSNVHDLAALPLEYMGYVPVYLDVRQGLPDYPLRGRYAGVVSWFKGGIERPDYPAWLARRVEEGIPVALLGDLGFSPDPEFLARLGMASAHDPVPPLRVSVYDSLLGFEAEPPRPWSNLIAYTTRDPDNRTHLTLTDASGQVLAPVVTGRWGGMALAPWAIDAGINGQSRWILDPFSFFRNALHLPDIPLPEVTTENGRRLWLAHIDGDGYLNRAEMPGTPYAAQTILEKILKKYPHWPHTVSIIEGEIGPSGLYPEQSPVLTRIAREIFRLPGVEIASHGYSHPFDWHKIIQNPEPSGVYNLPIPGYRFDLQREIAGSADYIDTQLAPAGKKTRLFLWTGDTLPDEAALAQARRRGLANLNGGNTIIRNEYPWLSMVSPMARPVGAETQIYAPVANENLYTELWRRNFSGYRRVIETFKLTDKPRRLKPIGIYYHFYSGSKPAGLRALHEAYDWSLKQETLPLYTSEYVARVQAFRRVGVARLQDGGLRYSGVDDLLTLRLRPGAGWPSLTRSEGVAGVRMLHDGQYISLAGKHTATLYLTDTPPQIPYLHQANAPLKDWRRDKDGIQLRLRGHLPVMLEIAGLGATTQCHIQWREGRLMPTATENGQRFSFPVPDTGDARLRCQ